MLIKGWGAARAGLVGQTTDPAVLTTEWASAKPGDCSLTEEAGAAPEAGDTGCTASHGEGAVAWSVKRYCQDKSDWLMYCTGDTWTASSGNTMSQFSSGGQTWATVSVDTDSSRPDSPQSWLSGQHTGNAQLNARCDDGSPSGWRNGGAVVICVEALTKGNFVAGICNLGKADDTPACATGFTTLNSGMIGSADCPMA